MCVYPRPEGTNRGGRFDINICELYLYIKGYSFEAAVVAWNFDVFLSINRMRSFLTWSMMGASERELGTYILALSVHPGRSLTER